MKSATTLLLILFLLPGCRGEQDTHPHASVRATTIDRQTNWQLGGLIAGLVFGALLSGLIQVIVHHVLLWRRRRSISEALIVEIRACSAQADGLAHYLKEHVRLSKVEGAVFSKHYLAHIGAPFWESVLGDPEGLRGPDMPKLVAFYSRVRQINEKIDVYHSEQSRLEELGTRDKPDVQMSSSIIEALIRFAGTTASMCEELEASMSLTAIGNLRTEYTDEFPKAPAPDGDTAQRKD